MSQIGKAMRLANIYGGKKRLVIVPMDHGPEMGPVKGIENPVKVIENLSKEKPNAFMIHRGILIKSYHILTSFNIPFILKLNTVNTEGRDTDRDILVDSVEDAVRFGASGVAFEFLMGSKYEYEMLRDLGSVASESEKWGLPLLVMAYPTGYSNNYDVSLIKHAVRIVSELGADIVKTSYTGSFETFAEVVDTSPVPVVMAGGEKIDRFEEVLQIVENVIKAGAEGVMIGRNIFQADDPAKALNEIEKIVWR
jgi:DhnA family fructose-bisphosphate aldolase class Ia